MRVIAHISDLHFGRVDDRIVAALTAEINASKPHLIAVSGDLTQRARVPEFRAARAFLDSFPQPKVIVPGNHDVPLFHLFDRVLRPLTKYRGYISADLDPYYSDEEIAVLGINTARSLVHKAGRINRRQVEISRSVAAAMRCTVASAYFTESRAMYAAISSRSACASGDQMRV